MRPAREGDIPVRVKNSYNRRAPGTLITKERDMSEVCCFAWLNTDLGFSELILVSDSNADMFYCRVF